MRKTTAALSLVLAVMTAGCGGAEEPAAAPAPSQQTVGEAAGVDTSLTPEEQTALLERLAAVAPALGTEDYVMEARSTCSDLQQGGSVDRNTALRFGDSEAGELSAEQVQAVIAAVRETFCDA